MYPAGLRGSPAASILPPVSTRRLILLALLCGLAILAAAALQFVLIARS